MGSPWYSTSTIGFRQRSDIERGAMLPPESASLDLSESMFDNRGKYDSNVEPQRSKHLSTSATNTFDLIIANKKQSLNH